MLVPNESTFKVLSGTGSVLMKQKAQVRMSRNKKKEGKKEREVDEERGLK